METNIIISVCMITYGHEKFIEEAINSILMQETEFDFELILANDNSPDNTDEIIKNIIANHAKGSLIRYIKHDKNIGMMPNFIFALDQCKGKYVALCEGDDYWIDAKKLQKQVSFLENNEDFAICYTRCHNLINNELSLEKNNTLEQEFEYKIDDLLVSNKIHTLTALVRNNFEIPIWFSESPLGDYPLFVLVSKSGKIKYFPDITSVYRIHCTSSWSSKNLIYTSERWLEVLIYLSNEINFSQNQILFNQFKIVYHRFVLECALNFKFENCKLLNVQKKYIISESSKNMYSYSQRTFFGYLFILKNAIIEIIARKIKKQIKY